MNSKLFNKKGEPLLSTAFRTELRSFLQDRLKDVIFRIVGEVKVYEDNYVGEKTFVPNKGKPMCYFVSQDDIYNPKNTESVYKSFVFYTTSTAHRPNDNFSGSKIVGLSHNMAELDIEGCTFKFMKPNLRAVHMPKSGDIVCGIAKPPEDVKRYKNPIFTQWFICSQQFVNFCTAILYDTHRTFEGKIGADLKELMMSKERLTTNNYLRWILGSKMGGLEISQQEDEKRFELIRTEMASKKYVDIYNAIYLIAVWGEFPLKSNIPQLKDYPQLTGWSVSRFVIKDLMSKIKNFDPRIYGEEQVSLDEAWDWLCGLARSDERRFYKNDKRGTRKELKYVKKDFLTKEWTPKQSEEGSWAAIARAPKVESDKLILDPLSPAQQTEIAKVEATEDNVWGEYAKEGSEKEWGDYDEED